jgi:hypothetical protein
MNEESVKNKKEKKGYFEDILYVIRKFKKKEDTHTTLSAEKDGKEVKQVLSHPSIFFILYSENKGSRMYIAPLSFCMRHTERSGSNRKKQDDRKEECLLRTLRHHLLLTRPYTSLKEFLEKDGKRSECQQKEPNFKCEREKKINCHLL